MGGVGVMIGAATLQSVAVGHWMGLVVRVHMCAFFVVVVLLLVLCVGDVLVCITTDGRRASGSATTSAAPCESVPAAAPRSVGRPLCDDAAAETARMTDGRAVTGLPCGGGGRSPAAAAASGVVAMAMPFLWATGCTAASRTCVQILYMTLCFCSASVASCFVVSVCSGAWRTRVLGFEGCFFFVSMPACFGF